MTARFTGLCRRDQSTQCNEWMD